MQGEGLTEVPDELAQWEVLCGSSEFSIPSLFLSLSAYSEDNIQLNQFCIKYVLRTNLNHRPQLRQRSLHVASLAPPWGPLPSHHFACYLMPSGGHLSPYHCFLPSCVSLISFSASLRPVPAPANSLQKQPSLQAVSSPPSSFQSLASSLPVATGDSLPTQFLYSRWLAEQGKEEHFWIYPKPWMVGLT